MKQLNNRSHVQECSEQVHRILAEYCNNCYPNVPVSIDRAAFTQTFYRSFRFADRRTEQISTFLVPTFPHFCFSEKLQKKSTVIIWGDVNVLCCWLGGEIPLVKQILFYFLQIDDINSNKLFTRFAQSCVCIQSSVT